jgi:hypothetical protein
MAQYLNTVALENNWLLLRHGRSTVDGLSLLSNVFPACLFGGVVVAKLLLKAILQLDVVAQI